MLRLHCRLVGFCKVMQSLPRHKRKPTWVVYMKAYQYGANTAAIQSKAILNMSL